jgi:excisionase family DNA binding protein
MPDPFRKAGPPPSPSRGRRPGTDTASETTRNPVATSTAEAAGAREPTEGTGQPNKIEVTVNGVRIEVPPELEAAVERAYHGLRQPLPKEMTTTQAAEFLDVSRPFVIKLIRRGELPCRMVGKHRRIPSDALRVYREKMFQRAKEAADEMAQLSQDLGFLEPEGPPSKAQ